MKLEFTSRDQSDSPTTCGFRYVQLVVEGVHFRDLWHACLPVSVPIEAGAKYYRPDVPSEYYEAGHLFRLAKLLGKLLAES